MAKVLQFADTVAAQREHMRALGRHIIGESRVVCTLGCRSGIFDKHIKSNFTEYVAIGMWRTEGPLKQEAHGKHWKCQNINLALCFHYKYVTPILFLPLGPTSSQIIYPQNFRIYRDSAMRSNVLNLFGIIRVWATSPHPTRVGTGTSNIKHEQCMSVNRKWSRRKSTQFDPMNWLSAAEN